MIHQVSISNPFADQYGSKKEFRLNNDVKIIKSVTMSVVDPISLETAIAGLPVEILFDLFKFSLILNSGNDEVFADVPYQYQFFRNHSDWGNVDQWNRLNALNIQKIHLNKEVVKNASHRMIFKMTNELIAYGDISAGTLAFVNWLRADGNFNLILYIEAE